MFIPEYKLAVVTEYENAPSGEKSAIPRREGLYSSHVIEWTRARDAGVLAGERADPAAPSKRSRKSAEQIELEKLRRRNAKLEADLTKTRLALDIMGKAHALSDVRTYPVGALARTGRDYLRLGKDCSEASGVRTDGRQVLAYCIPSAAEAAS